VNILDLVPVAPRHRFDTIMSAYARLEVSQRLELRLDHEPECLYYTLLATRGDDAFAMEYLEAGPEVWRVRVEKRLLHPEDVLLRASDATSASS
jgi:uncharacterized protein (DUF2249 family)